jgi:sirohydrochlorin ferrochelatase
MGTAVIILGHGSRRAGAGAPLQTLAAAMRQSGGYSAVEHAFIQYSSPTFDSALDSCVQKGAGRVVIVPFFVQPGNHVTEDIPRMVREAQKKYPSVAFQVTDLVGSHPLVIDIVADLVRKVK